MGRLVIFGLGYCGMRLAQHLLETAPGQYEIAGTVRSNAAAVAARLTDADVAAVGEAVPEATGDRYEGMHGTFNTRL
jgi:3-hydroxyisobutyrate dehydrogenase-like beta-hydroxyacid dehydrogenase